MTLRYIMNNMLLQHFEEQMEELEQVQFQSIEINRKSGKSPCEKSAKLLFAFSQLWMFFIWFYNFEFLIILFSYLLIFIFVQWYFALICRCRSMLLPPWLHATYTMYKGQTNEYGIQCFELIFMCMPSCIKSGTKRT